MRECPLNKHTDLGSVLSPDEFPEMILERQYFIDDRTSHCTDPIALELKNRIASL
jgi:hypothetical protein